MKQFALIPMIALSGLISAPASAEFVGGEVELSFSKLSGTSGDRKSLEGAVEFAFNDTLGVQIDLGYHHLTNDIGTISLHGIYHVNEATSVGAFITREFANGGGDLDSYGIEAAHHSGAWSFEGFASKWADRTLDFKAVGIDARYGFQNGLGLSGSIDHIDFGFGAEVSLYGVTLDYDVAENMNLYATVGQFRTSFGASETYFTLGGKMTFGNKNGTSFERRGLMTLLPTSP